MNIYIPNLRLPSEYQEVEYIESSGTQYINSGVNLTTNIGFEVDFNISNSIGSVGYAVLGGRYRGWDNELNLDTFNRSNGGVFAYGSTSINPKFVPNTRQQCSFKNLVFTDCEGIATNVTSYTFNRTVPLYIFACVETKNTSVVDKISMKLYSCKMYDGNTLVRDLVPCYRKSDSVIGMYDLVNNQFYTNSGTGTFSKGSDVTMAELQNAYIGEYGWKPGSNTVAYRPLNGNYNDIVGGNNGTATSGMGFATLGSRQVAQVNSTQSGISIPGSVMNSIGTGDFTVSFWSKLVSKQGTAENLIMGIWYEADPRPGVFVWLGTNNISFQIGNSRVTGPNPSTLYGSWHHFCLSRRSGVIYCYIDGELQGSYTYSTSLNFNYGYIVSRNHSVQYMSVGTQGAEYIIERVGWDSAEISDYYNQTKSNYGL